MPAQEKPLSPERQLLKLIEEPANGAGLALASVKRHGVNLFSPAAWISKISFLTDKFQAQLKAGDFRHPDIKVVNKLLEIFVFSLAIYFIASFSVSLFGLRKMPDLSAKASGSEARPLNFKESSFLKAATYYLERVRSRDIFRIGQKNVSGGSERGPSSRLIELTQNLRLAGISWSSDPDVMIEDTQAHRTYFLKSGQSVGNLNLKISAVFRDKVILSSQGEEIELK